MVFNLGKLSMTAIEYSEEWTNQDCPAGWTPRTGNEWIARRISVEYITNQRAKFDKVAQNL